jgi:hypothetical protein
MACDILGRGVVHTGFLWLSLVKIYNLEDTGIDGRIILKWLFKKFIGRSWTQLIWLRMGTGGRAGECGNKAPCMIQY